MKNIWLSTIIACLLVGLTSVANAAFTAGMTQQFKNNAITAVLVTGSPTISFALGLQASNTSIGPGTTATSSFTKLASSHGYADATLGSCTVASTGGSSPLAADFNCANAVFTSNDSTGFSADCGMLYYSTVPIAFYTWTTASATGNGGTITVTMPTVAAGTRGLISIAGNMRAERYIIASGMDGRGVYLVPVYHLNL